MAPPGGLWPATSPTVLFSVSAANLAAGTYVVRVISTHGAWTSAGQTTMVVPAAAHLVQSIRR
jgi:hypothetical protein